MFIRTIKFNHQRPCFQDSQDIAKSQEPESGPTGLEGLAHVRVFSNLLLFVSGFHPELSNRIAKGGRPGLTER